MAPLPDGYDNFIKRSIANCANQYHKQYAWLPVKTTDGWTWFATTWVRYSYSVADVFTRQYSSKTNIDVIERITNEEYTINTLKGIIVNGKLLESTESDNEQWF